SDETADELITAEMSPDGNEATWSYNYGMKRVDVATGKVTRVGHVHASSLWYRDDGALAYAGLDNAFVRRGEALVRFLPGSNDAAGIAGVRPRRDAAGLLVVKKGELLAWDPDGGKIERLARAEGLVDADVWKGGVVTLVSRPDPTDPPHQASF